MILFEGASKLVNGAGGFVPGRVGIYEAGSAAVAEALRLGSSYGVSLALTRRARSLVWAMAGVVLLGHRSLRRSRRRTADGLGPSGGERHLSGAVCYLGPSLPQPAPPGSEKNL